MPDGTMVHALPYPATMVRLLLVCLLQFLLSAAAWAQPAQQGTARVEILNADVWQFDEKLAPGAQRLKGNVRFRHENALMRCDSAWLYDDQRVEAFSRVNINQGDTVVIDGDRLHYNGQQRAARIDGNVRLRDKDMELTTPSLDYDMRGRRAVYTQGGTIISRADNSRLTSDAGVYNTATRVMVFSQNVRLDHPDRTIESDTMHYGTSTGVAEFFGPTVITQDSTVIHTTRGTYDTKAEKARFSRRSSVETKGRLLEGDSMF
jgi:lipopolysaccharide export system protein LptA